jgi:hypothetical protein
MISIYYYYPNKKGDVMYSLVKPIDKKAMVVRIPNEVWERYKKDYLKEYFDSPEEMAWYYEV